jgi:hypothetical protein
MLQPSKPLRHTMPDDDEEVQTQVEEAFRVRQCLCRKNQNSTSDIVMILYFTENGGVTTPCQTS